MGTDKPQDHSPQRPPHDESQEGSRTKMLPLFVGLFLGFAASWLTIFVTILGLYSATGGSSGTQENVIAVLGLFGIPVLCGALLIPRRTRHWGAGFVMGLAIGSISGAGVCAGFMGMNAI